MKSRLWVVALAVAAVVGVLVGCGSRAGAEQKVWGPMPAWSLKATDGKVLSSKDLAGKVLIVDFWASWCPPCKEEIPGFIELQQKYGAEGLQVVGFSFDQTEEDHAGYHKRAGMNYPSMFASNEEGQKVSAAFEKVIGAIEGIPTTVIVDRKGNIVFSHVGYAPKETFEEVVVPLLKQK